MKGYIKLMLWTQTDGKYHDIFRICFPCKKVILNEDRNIQPDKWTPITDMTRLMLVTSPTQSDEFFVKVEAGE